MYTVPRINYKLRADLDGGCHVRDTTPCHHVVLSGFRGNGELKEQVNVR